MNILVATDGALDAGHVADVVARWHEPGDRVTVYTVVNIPTDFLRRLGDRGVSEAAKIAQEAGQTLSAGDRAAERLVRSMPADDHLRADNPVFAALAETAHGRTGPVVDALEARGVNADARWQSSDGRVAQTILSKAKSIDADLVVVGSHGGNRFEGRMGSVGTKIVRNSPANVLVIRAPVAGSA